MTRYAPAIVLLFVCSFLLVGCSEKTDAPIEAAGTVQLDGTNLEMGMVVFAPEAGGESKSGQIVKDGTFKLYAISPGKYRVAVQTAMFAGLAAPRPTPPAGGPAISMREIDGKFQAVPRKYESPETSGLIVEVRLGERIRLELSSRG
jgi:hypothetical protein